MIFMHPTTNVKARVNRNNSLAVSKYRREGWLDVTPPRTAKQNAASAKFLAAGKLSLALFKLREVIVSERSSLDVKQIEILNKTEIILQQLNKKYRSNQTPKK